MKAEALENIRQIANSHSKALRCLQKTVDYARDEVIDEALTCLLEGKEVFLMGVKNTSTISMKYIKKLQENGFLFHTLDNIDEEGRAIYTSLRNPLTSCVMTGSSATTSIHVLRNINQIGLGSDGGGSVLAPALSCGLYAIMGKGIGLMGKNQRVSTDGISFQPGIGVIGQQYEICQKAINFLISDLHTRKNIETFEEDLVQAEIKIKHGLSKYNKIGIIQWNEESEVWVDKVKLMLPKYDFLVYKMRKTTNRQELLKLYEMVTQEVDIMISKEGPIDIRGSGDSIIGNFGYIGNKIQKMGEKYFLKIANMVDATAIAIPNGELSSGYLILAKSGIESGMAAIDIGAQLAEQIKLPQVFTDYFYHSHIGKDFFSI